MSPLSLALSRSPVPIPIPATPPPTLQSLSPDQDKYTKVSLLTTARVAIPNRVLAPAPRKILLGQVDCVLSNASTILDFQ